MYNVKSKRADEFIDDKEIAQEAMDADIALETEEEETSEN